MRYKCFVNMDPDEQAFERVGDIASRLIREAEASGRSDSTAHVIDTTNDMQLVIAYDEDYFDLRHMNHPLTAEFDEREVYAMWYALERVKSACLRYMGRWKGDRWKEYPSGVRRCRGGKRLWRLYERFHRASALRWCGMMKLRDREAERLLKEMVDAVESEGHEVSVTDASGASFDYENTVKLVHDGWGGTAGRSPAAPHHL